MQIFEINNVQNLASGNRTIKTQLNKKDVYCSIQWKCLKVFIS